jgi:phosphoribosylaminoimidazole (AIR) synthetase
MVVILPEKEADVIIKRLNELGDKSYLIGQIAIGNKGIEIS